MDGASDGIEGGPARRSLEGDIWVNFCVDSHVMVWLGAGYVAYWPPRGVEREVGQVRHLEARC